VTSVSETTRWTANAIVGWRPILTFTRRRLAFLDWFEEQFGRPLSFTDTPEHAGVAVGRKEQRLRIDRSSLRLMLGSPECDVQELASTVAGVWSALEPDGAAMSFYRGAWSAPLDLPYEETRRRLTERSAGTQFGDLGVAYDSATLLNIKAGQLDGSFEFGVVTREELATRLNDPNMGMLGRSAAEGRGPIDLSGRELPEVSLFVDVGATVQVHLKNDVEAISAFEAVERTVAQLVTALQETL
jgi:hypothetical protein